MAHKRMFSKDITESDAFLDMPATTQLLYFHLGMKADDDGFIGNPKSIQRGLGCSGDDMSLLLGKHFLLAFPSGVVVIKHHRINNNWDRCNHKRTLYQEELCQLFIKENKAYTLEKTQGIAVKSDSSLETDYRLDKIRKEKNTNTGDFLKERERLTQKMRIR